MRPTDTSRERSHWGRLGVVGVGVAAVVAALGLGPGRRGGGPAPLSATEPATVTRVEADPGISLTRMTRHLQGRPADGASGSVTASAAPVARRWDLRLRTNGVVDLDQALVDPEYAKQLRRHRRIKALLLSPARETPECEAIIGLTERLGISVAAVPDLYNALWEFRSAERSAREAGDPAGRDAAVFIGEIGWGDFQLRFTRDLGIPAEPVFQELLTLDLHPTVFFGVPELIPERRNEGLFVEE